MIIVCGNADKEKLRTLTEKFESQGFRIHLSKGAETTIIGLIGDTSRINVEDVEALDIVEKVQRVSEPYKLVNRKFHSEDTVIDVGGVKIGGGHFAFKPRTSPYAFRGLKEKGLELLLTAKRETGLPVVTELMSLEHIDLFNDVDIIQVGARNMQNFEMLAELGKCRKPILLKRGLANTIEEWLMSAEYIMSGGNESVILCERGIRTFETATRNTFDVSAIPVLHQLTHLPVIADPSHASGKSSLIRPLAKSAAAAGADGLMIEVHPNPSQALCDGAQSLTPEAFKEVMNDVRKICALENKII